MIRTSAKIKLLDRSYGDFCELSFNFPISSRLKPSSDKILYLFISVHKYTAWPKNKKVATWIISVWVIIFQLATSYLTPTDAMKSVSFLKQPCRKTHPVVVENMFEKGQLMGMIG